MREWRRATPQAPSAAVARAAADAPYTSAASRALVEAGRVAGRDADGEHRARRHVQEALREAAVQHARRRAKPAGSAHDDIATTVPCHLRDHVGRVAMAPANLQPDVWRTAACPR